MHQDHSQLLKILVMVLGILNNDIPSTRLTRKHSKKILAAIDLPSSKNIQVATAVCDKYVDVRFFLSEKKVESSEYMLVA